MKTTFLMIHKYLIMELNNRCAPTVSRYSSAFQWDRLALFYAKYGVLSSLNAVAADAGSIHFSSKGRGWTCYLRGCPKHICLMTQGTDVS
jgi:hypothetical protein